MHILRLEAQRLKAANEELQQKLHEANGRAGLAEELHQAAEAREEQEREYMEYCRKEKGRAEEMAKKWEEGKLEAERAAMALKVKLALRDQEIKELRGGKPKGFQPSAKELERLEKEVEVYKEIADQEVRDREEYQEKFWEVLAERDLLRVERMARDREESRMVEEARRTGQPVLFATAEGTVSGEFYDVFLTVRRREGKGHGRRRIGKKPGEPRRPQRREPRTEGKHKRWVV